MILSTPTYRIFLLLGLCACSTFEALYASPITPPTPPPFLLSSGVLAPPLQKSTIWWYKPLLRASRSWKKKHLTATTLLLGAASWLHRKHFLTPSPLTTLHHLNATTNTLSSPLTTESKLNHKPPPKTLHLKLEDEEKEAQTPHPPSPELKKTAPYQWMNPHLRGLNFEALSVDSPTQDLLYIFNQELLRLEHLHKVFSLWSPLLEELLSYEENAQALTHLHEELSEHLLVSSALWDALVPLDLSLLRLSYEEVSAQLLDIRDSLRWFSLHLKHHFPGAYSVWRPYFDEVITPNLEQSAHFLLSLKETLPELHHHLGHTHDHSFLTTGVYVAMSPEILATEEPHLRYITYIKELLEITKEELGTLSQGPIIQNQSTNSSPAAKSNPPAKSSPPANPNPSPPSSSHEELTHTSSPGDYDKELIQELEREELEGPEASSSYRYPGAKNFFDEHLPDAYKDHLLNQTHTLKHLAALLTMLPQLLEQEDPPPWFAAAPLITPPPSKNLRLSYAEIGRSLLELTEHINHLKILTANTHPSHDLRSLLEELHTSLWTSGSFLLSFEHQFTEALKILNHERFLPSYKSALRQGVRLSSDSLTQAHDSLTHLYLGYLSQILNTTSLHLAEFAEIL